MTTEQKNKQMENKYQLTLEKYNTLLANVEEKNAEYKSILDETEIARFEYTQMEKKQRDAAEQLKQTEDTLKAKQTELTLMEKDIQIAKLTQKTEMERAEADRKFDAIMEEYLKCEPFFIEFLKLSGKRVTKRNEQGEIVETKAVYDIYLEARERRRKRMVGAAMSTRRLPDISGIVDTSDTAPGGVESGGKHPTVPACPAL